MITLATTTVGVTATVLLTAENFWTTYHAYENLICSI